MEDKYIIYKINRSQFNGELDYMFKSNYPMAQVASDMDQEEPKNPLHVRRHISMAYICDVLVIKHWYCLYIIQPCASL